MRQKFGVEPQGQSHSRFSLFTGDAGQGESNIRRWIIENDWLEAIVALPLNMFYNTGIATYVWVLTNRKPDHRKGYVQLIDATQWYTPLRRNLGQKNCELSPENVRQIIDAFMDFEDTEQSMIFPNEAFGYWKVTVERPLRLGGTDPERVYKAAEIKKLKVENEKDGTAAPIIKKVLPADAEPNPLWGKVTMILNGKPVVVEYEPDTDLRDTEQIPLLHPGGIEAFLQEEVLPTGRTPGTTPRLSESGTKSTSTGTSTNPSQCAPWRRSGQTYWRWNRKRKGCWREFSVKTRNDNCDPRTRAVNERSPRNCPTLLGEPRRLRGLHRR